MVEINNRTKNKIDIALVKLVAERFLRHYKLIKKEVSIAFVGDKEISKLNKVYRKIDKATDVLSFSGEDDFLGEIVIDYAQIKRQAKEFKKSTNEELIFILVHGLLHLVGYDDRTEKGRVEMIGLGEKFLNNSKIKICHSEAKRQDLKSEAPGDFITSLLPTGRSLRSRMTK
jgi:probable rRNA maturation factor